MLTSSFILQLAELLKNDGEDLHPTQTLSSLEDFKPEQWGLPPFEN
jgi:predicted component of type VI protein secretion system